MTHRLTSFIHLHKWWLLGSLGLIGALVAWQLYHNQTIAQTNQASLNQLKTTLHTSLNQTNQSLQQADGLGAATAIERLQETVRQALKQQPQAARIGWYSLSLSSTEQQEYQARQTALRNLDDRLEVTRQLLTYQDHLTTILKPLHDGQATNGQHYQDLLKTWTQAKDSLDNTIVPQAVQNQHQQLTSLVQDSSQKLNQLAELYQTKNRSQFDQVLTQFNHDIVKLNDLSKDYDQVFAQQDQDLARTLDQLLAFL